MSFALLLLIFSLLTKGMMSGFIFYLVEKIADKSLPNLIPISTVTSMVVLLVETFRRNVFTSKTTNINLNGKGDRSGGVARGITPTPPSATISNQIGII